MKRIEKVAIVGGTHGNELTGVYAVKNYEQYPKYIQRSSFESLPLLANPKAVAARRRYVERDLNRCFSDQDLNDLTRSSYEDVRAKEIDRLIGPKGNPQVDAIVDLHSTTANMGLTIILRNYNPFNLRLAAYLSTIHPLVKVLCLSNPVQDSHFLGSICELGCVIEVGPIAQGILNSLCFMQTEQLLFGILNYIDDYNCNRILSVPSSLTLYQGLEVVDYPRNKDGDLKATIHPELQFKDYSPLNLGEPMFLTFDERAIAYTGQSTVYPVFINEAAYYEKGIAMYLTEKQQVAI